MPPGPRSSGMQSASAHGSGQESAGSVPFVLATPHHSRAWEQVQGQTALAISNVEATLTEYQATLAEWEQARQQNLLTAEDLGQLDAMCQEYQALVAEYEQMNHQDPAGSR